MMYPPLKKSPAITAAERVGNSLILKSDRGLHRIQPVNESTARISYTQREEFSARIKPAVIISPDFADWTFTDKADMIVYTSQNLVIEIDKSTSAMTYFDGKGKLLLRERNRNPKMLSEFESYMICDDSEVEAETIQTADGKKEIVKKSDRKLDGKYYHTKLYLDFCEGEALYGFGQQEEGNLNLRGKRIYLHQANKKIQVPFMVSTNGYGILFDVYSPMIFSDNEFGSYIHTEAADEIDFYFISASTPDGAIKEYRALTGKAAMLPKWAFGYTQSKERYLSAEDLINTASTFRSKGIGLDTLVLDWMSWPDGMWGQKSFDKNRFPDPKGMMNTLHDMDVHLMMSIWPNAERNTENYAEFKREGCLLPGSVIYNAFSEKGRQVYWNQLQREIFCNGIDAWWCDSSEPFTTEWNHIDLPEPADNYREFFNVMSSHVPAWQTSAFCLYHAQGVYEGQRSVSDKRVLNLTRSGYIGQQRYGTVMWSGDISATWDVYRKQIPESLNFSASGLPYWTVDIGAFFVREGIQHYWAGDYHLALEDAGYRELYTRWLQWAVFLPMFRSHGTDCEREPWRFDDESHIFYNAIVDAIKLRYKLMPYIYSQAGRAWLYDDSIIKPLAFSFPWDSSVYDIKDQYMFVDSIMVCPVTEPMYFGVGSVPLEKDKTRKVYLPAGCDWYDFHTGTKYIGGQTVIADADITKLPLFVKAGSIIPTAPESDRTHVKDDVTFVVYPGADGEFTLYEDDGLTYAYEKGEYTVTTVTWNDSEKLLTADRDIPLNYTVI